MKVTRLIEMLQKHSPDSEIQVLDVETGTKSNIEGIIDDGGDSTQPILIVA